MKALVLTACALAVGASLLSAPDGAVASTSEHAVVPVLAQLDGRVPSGRLSGAAIRVYAGRDGADRRLVGRGRTGSRGVALVALRGATVPGHLRVVVRAPGNLGNENMPCGLQLDAGPGVPYLANATFSTSGRPVLFARRQSAADCFYFAGATSPATGPGCLTVRDRATTVLP